MSTTNAVILTLVILGLAAAVWFVLRRRRSQHLRSRFGPEYQRAIQDFGSQARAEEALAKREKRLERLSLHPLTPEDANQFDKRWHELQARFVDDPAASIHEADTLICEVMQARGYPMTDWERRAEDISVHHPAVVQNYRTAHEIAMRHENGQASTEDLRHALVCYRDLFDEMLEAEVIEPRRGRVNHGN
jgi:hypothetical protein